MLIMLLIPILPIFGLITQNVIALNDIILKKVRQGLVIQCYVGAFNGTFLHF